MMRTIQHGRQRADSFRPAYGTDGSQAALHHDRRFPAVLVKRREKNRVKHGKKRRCPGGASPLRAGGGEADETPQVLVPEEVTERIYRYRKKTRGEAVTKPQRVKQHRLNRPCPSTALARPQCSPVHSARPSTALARMAPPKGAAEEQGTGQGRAGQGGYRSMTAIASRQAAVYAPQPVGFAGAIAAPRSACGAAFASGKLYRLRRTGRRFAA